MTFIEINTLVMHLIYTQKMVYPSLSNYPGFICMGVSKDKVGKHLSELAGTADFACGQKHRVDDLLKSLSDCFSLIL